MSTLLIANNRTEAMVGELVALTETERRIAGCGAHRALWLARDSDVVVLPWLPEKDYLDYVSSWTGTRHATLRLLAPPPGVLGADLLTRDRLADPEFLARLRETIADLVIDEVVPVVAEPEIAALVRSLGLRKAWPGCDFSGQGGTAIVNSKAVFRAIAAGTGVPVAGGAVAVTVRAAEDAIEEILAAGQPVILKQDHKVGGAGNEVLSRVPGVAHPGAERLEVLADRTAVADYLRDRWEWLTGGRREPVVIEQYVPGSVAVYAEYTITDDGIDLLVPGQMTMGPILTGVMMPAPVLTEDQNAYLVDQGRRLLEPYLAMGYRGVASTDAILTPAGSVLFTEVNGRISGASHIFAMIAGCLGSAGLDGRLVLVRGGWQAPSFRAAIDRIDEAGLLLDRESRTGVLPDVDTTMVNGSFGVSIVAEDTDGTANFERRLDDLFR
jgi:hypothetical protein